MFIIVFRWVPILYWKLCFPWPPARHLIGQCQAIGIAVHGRCPKKAPKQKQRVAIATKAPLPGAMGWKLRKLPWKCWNELGGGQPPSWKNASQRNYIDRFPRSRGEIWKNMKPRFAANHLAPDPAVWNEGWSKKNSCLRPFFQGYVLQYYNTYFIIFGYQSVIKYTTHDKFLA